MVYRALCIQRFTRAQHRVISHARSYMHIFLNRVEWMILCWFRIYRIRCYMVLYVILGLVSLPRHLYNMRYRVESEHKVNGGGPLPAPITHIHISSIKRAVIKVCVCLCVCAMINKRMLGADMMPSNRDCSEYMWLGTGYTWIVSTQRL